MSKCFRDYIRQVLLETALAQPDPRGFKSYYSIDPQNPPPIQDIVDTWAENSAQVYDSCVNTRNPAYYHTRELTPYREHNQFELRNPSFTDHYLQLKKDIREKGIKEPLVLHVGQDGKAKIGEGNHRHQIALELGIEKCPVRFLFVNNVSSDSESWRVAWQKSQESDIDVDDLMKLMGF